jgi:predicted transcriptional regulator
MSEKVRLNLQISEELNKQLEAMAENSSTTKTEIIRRAMALMKAAQRGVAEGKHLGFAKDPEKLDQEIVGIV